MAAPSTKTIRTYESTSAPTANDDTTAGFSKHDEWLETDTDTIWKCTDATAGAAKWRQITIPALGTDGQILKVVSGALAFAADA